ncbi:hypothetical protein BC938DRAFT_481577 [Jimgerdemannia flammicorona]|uniref:RRN7-type domain-containing protein n=1 Tax=Jimgerdemannia flammicorona TaxID=994334 RepID=A0A433QFU8_9FUNG|nr:hypothetical protein BC938DRAFT_481577 [Jimgerdemannia flammicorona]
MKLGQCPKCKTKKWRKNELGFYICKYGHQLENYQEEENEFDENMGTVRQRKKAKHKTISEIVQELWLLYISSTDLVNSKDTLDFPRSSQAPPSQSQPQQIDPPLPLQDEVDVEFAHAILAAAESDEEIEETDGTQLAAGRNGNASDDSQESGYDDENLGSESEIKTKTGLNRRDALLRKQSTVLEGWKDARKRLLLQFSLILCYLGCVWCRAPVLLADLHRWALNGKIPYFTAYLNLPQEMREHFHVTHWNQLELRRFTSCALMHNWVSRFVLLYRHVYDIEFPEPNVPLVIYRHVRELLLPGSPYIYIFVYRNTWLFRFEHGPNLELYTAAINLFTLLEHRLRANDMSEKKLKGKPLPCVTLMAVVVVASKLCFGLDDQKRERSENDGLFTYFPSKIAWLKELDLQHNDRERHSVPVSYRDMRNFAEDYQQLQQFFSSYRPEPSTLPSDTSLSADSITSTHLHKLLTLPLPKRSSAANESLGARYLTYEKASDDPNDYHAQYAKVITHAAHVVGVKVGTMQIVCIISYGSHPWCLLAETVR